MKKEHGNTMSITGNSIRDVPGLLRLLILQEGYSLDDPEVKKVIEEGKKAIDLYAEALASKVKKN